VGCLALLFSFKGRIGRAPYALVAIPILLISLFRTSIATVIVGFVDGFARGVGAPIELRNGSFVMIPAFLAVDLLILPLLAVSFKRLHDLGRSGLWSLPYLARLIPMVVGALWLTGHHEIGAASFATWLRAILGVSFFYGLALALALAVIPGKIVAPSGASQDRNPI
jgi:uncharacterized membrane protein YhaH (DUF805 family)